MPHRPANLWPSLLLTGLLLGLAFAATAQPAVGPAPLLGKETPDLPPEVAKRLEQTGLVVLPDRTETSLHDAYYGLEMAGNPRYITADAMLSLWYEAHRQALMAVEKQWLRPQLLALADRLLQATRQLRTAAAEQEALRRGNTVMLEVACCLLDPARKPAADLADSVTAELQRVRDHTLVEVYPGEDYTQYEVRGYYTRNAELRNYFRGAKYLARRYYRVSDGGHPEDADRELRGALLLALALRGGPGLRELYREIVELRVFLCGPVDTIGLDQLLAAAEAVWGAGWGPEKLADLSALRTELETDRYPVTRINTRVTDPGKAMMPPRNVAVLGEHYLPDSELFHQTCEPEVMGRHLPSGLDVATALGSGLAAEKLQAEAAAFPQVVPRAREFGGRMKPEGVCGAWLGTLRALFERPDGLPPFAQGEAYAHKQLNCCLASWAHLRHNYLLYGAQASTCAGLGPSPGGLVEPLPGFFAAYGAMCRGLRERLAASRLEGRVPGVLQRLEQKAGVFERCAKDQLAGRDTSWAREDIEGFAGFIAGVYFDSPVLIADVATSSQTREVLHAASGPFHEVLVRCTLDGKPAVAYGFVGSYYEFAEPAMGRLTDEQWQERLEREYGPPQPPSWLAGLYQAAPEEGTAQRRRLAQIEALLAADRYEEAKTAAEALIAAEQETRWAPEAVLLVGSYLLGHKRQAEGLALLERARPLYGCEARSTALRLIRGYPESRAAWEEEQAERERRLAARLAATDPREGLSEAQELARQNRRAALLLGIGDLPVELVPAESLRRLLAECPRSEYVPAAEVLQALSAVPASYESSIADEPEPAVLRTVRAELLALSAKYSGSVVGQQVRVTACSLLPALGQHEAAYAELLPLLALDPPRPEPYPASAALLGGTWEFGGPGGTMTSPRYLLERLLEHLLPQACRAGDLARVREYLAAGRKYPGLGDDGPGELALLVDYLQSEPEALRFLLSSGLVGADGYEEPEGQTADAGARLKQGLQLVSRAPKAKGARTILFALWRAEHRAACEEGEAGAPRSEVARRLIADYPESLETLVVRARQAHSQGDEAGRLRLVGRALALAPQGEESEPGRPGSYPEWLAYELPFEPRLQPNTAEQAAWKQRYGALIAAAGVKGPQLAALGQESQLVALLIKRLPRREPEVLIAASQDPRASYWLSEPLGQAIARYAKDPRVWDLRFARGSFEDLAALIAHGPRTPHFAEAVQRFAVWRTGGRTTQMEAELRRYEAAAAAYPKTATAALAAATSAEILLHYECPEEALRLVAERLSALPEGTPLREKLAAQRESAERQIALKRASANPPLWTAALRGLGTRYEQSPGPRLVSAAGGTVVLGYGVLPDGRIGIAAFETATGKRLWATPCPDVGVLHYAAGGLLFATRHGTFGRLDAADGHLVWEKPVGLSRSGRVWLSAEGETLVLYWEQGLLAAADAASGTIQWQREAALVGSDSDPDREAGPLAVCRGTIAAWDKAQTLRSWRLADGQPLWSLTPAQVSGTAAAADRPHYSLLAPARCGDGLVAGFSGDEGCLAGLDPANGRVRWRQSAGYEFSLLPLPAAQRAAAFTRSEGRLRETAPGDGALRWQFPVARDEGPLPLAVSDGHAVLVDTDLVVLERTGGQVVARQPLAEGAEALAVGATEAGAVTVVLATREGLKALRLRVAR